ncbi:hypothetical protein OG596_33950 [Streptomyces sp. NBC_01102]|uniref:hypothetical protein n=1 Tax=unclassified Streptomyces TaxID=2593676 RepID=UPI0038669F82|nr:hypothetical protein OG596_33950 [Streptomyces sp. NBC_01102]
MAYSAREALSEAIEQNGHDGKLLVFHGTDDPLGTSAEGADLPPFDGIEGRRSTLRERVAKANARSRGEVL